MPAIHQPCRSLTLAMKRGDEAAWTQFHGQYYEFVFGSCLKLSREYHTAQDLAQRVFLRIVRHMKVFDDFAHFDNWIRCLTRCVYIDHVRKSARQMTLLEKFTQMSELDTPDPFAIALQEERLEKVMSSLSQPERELVSAFYLERRNQAEIAAKLGITARAVESRLGRIKRNLQNLWKTDINPNHS